MQPKKSWQKFSFFLEGTFPINSDNTTKELKQLQQWSSGVDLALLVLQVALEPNFN